MDVQSYYQKYGPMVLRRCRKILGNEELAHEALQETFMRFMERSSGDACGSSFFYTVATNICLNILKSKEYRRGLAPCGDVAQILCSSEMEQDTLAQQLFDRLIHGHDQLMKKIVLYHVIDEMTLEETAKLLGLSVGQVRRSLQYFHW